MVPPNTPLVRVDAGASGGGVGGGVRGDSAGAVGGGGAVGDGGWFVPGMCAWDVLLEAAAEAEATSREHAAGTEERGAYVHIRTTAHPRLSSLDVDSRPFHLSPNLLIEDEQKDKSNAHFFFLVLHTTRRIERYNTRACV